MNGYHEFGIPGPETVKTIRAMENEYRISRGLPIADPARLSVEPLRNAEPPIAEMELGIVQKLILLRSEWNTRSDDEH